MDYGISRADQDEYAVLSYKRATQAWSNGVLATEVEPMMITKKKNEPGVLIDNDEEYLGFKPDKMATLR